jgi:hypothetical protein
MEEIPVKKNIDVRCIRGSALLLITPAVRSHKAKRRTCPNLHLVMTF